ncbi:MAG: phenylalanine--tRNA ligase subunit beta [bacterium]
MSLTPEQLAERMTVAGINVERVLRRSVPPHVVVGRVLEVTPHPNADRLRCALVDLGKGRQERIVCGAPNLSMGQRVAVALPGTTLPNGVTIRAASIRGVPSAGMICAADELGLGDDHTGILVLDQRAVVGTPAASALGADETVFDIEITPNRSDCLSVLGCAREVAALTGRVVREPGAERRDHSTLPPRTLSIRIADRSDCPLYSARIIEGVAADQPSPRWMQDRLFACGIRPVSAIIDVTNYVMLELGQPLHAFDAAAVPKGKIIVRRAKNGEQILALDGKTYALNDQQIVIASTERPIAIAGLMGGEASGIHENTKTVILESAVFHPGRIRSARKTLGLASESSYRFERSVNPHSTLLALDRAATLMAKIAGGMVRKGRSVRGALPRVRKPIALSLARANAVLNLSLTAQEVKRLLAREGATVRGTAKRFSVHSPDYRQDLVIEEDLIEELGRLVGYPKLPLSALSGALRPVDVPPIWQLRDDLVDALASLGGFELLSYPFYDRKLAEQIGLPLAQHVRVKNPLSCDQELLRLSLLPMLLKKASVAARDEDVVFLFEAGRTFFEDGKPLPDERERCALVVVQPEPYRALKGYLLAVLEMLGMARGGTQWEKADLLYGQGETFAASGQKVGRCAQLSPALRSAFKFRTDVAVAELDLVPLLSVRSPVLYTRTSPFPAVRRDIAFWIPQSVTYDKVEEICARIDRLLVATELFDVYKKEHRRSIALHLTFQSPERTLTSADVDRILIKLTSALTTHLHADIRTTHHV